MEVVKTLLSAKLVFNQLWAGSVLRFSYLSLVGRIVTLRPRLCKEYLTDSALKIWGAVNKETAKSRTVSVVFIRHLKVVQVFLELILRRKASAAQVSRLRLPFIQSPIIEHFQLFINDKRHDIIFQAFFEQNQSADTPVAILKGMDRFKFIMKRNQVFQRFTVAFTIPFQKRRKSFRNFSGRRSIFSAHFVGKFFILTNHKPILSGITGSAF